MPGVPQATPAPIHDIADDLLAYLLRSGVPLWLIAALAFLALIGLVFWLTRRRRTTAVLTPRQRALAALEELRREGPEADSYAFGVRISDILRTYIRDQHGLDAVTRTSLEFLDALRDNSAFTDHEKSALAEFLESVDLLKYARLPAVEDDIQSLLTIAERLLRAEKDMPLANTK